MNTIESKADEDCSTIIQFINNHPIKQDIISMYHKGPPKNEGFMWCSREEGHWTKRESDAFKIMEQIILKYGWDSSGYGYMQRQIQSMVKKLYPTPTTETQYSKNMDENNKKIMDIWKEKGVEEAIKNMFIDQDTGRTLSYSEMRMKYG